MRKLIASAATGLFLAATGFYLFAYGAMGPGMGSRGGMGMMFGSTVRRNVLMRNGIDPKYSGLSSPLANTATNISGGRQIYDQFCASCHGAQGLGDGPASKGLTPAPASLSGLGRMPMISDGYLDWTIAEGGVPVGSAMPPFKDVLKSNDIWQVILYIRSL